MDLVAGKIAKIVEEDMANPSLHTLTGASMEAAINLSMQKNPTTLVIYDMIQKMIKNGCYEKTYGLKFHVPEDVVYYFEKKGITIELLGNQSNRLAYRISCKKN